MNKNNLIKVLIVSIVFAIFILPLISAPPPDSPEPIDIEPVDGTVNLEGKSGEITITEEFNAIKIAGGTIPNVKSGSLVVEDGNPVSGKLFFSDDSSFDLDNQHITVPKDGYIEFKDGKIIVSKDTTIEVDDTKIQAMIDETEIKIEENVIEVKGYISVDYENSPDEIILIGEDSILELQTEEKEKFEFKNLDDKELIVNIGSFHKSEDCIEKNCISYQEMGIGMSGEEWNKLKIDGNAIITKYYNEEKIYEIKFEDGKAKLNRDLSKLKDTEFNQKTVINYNSGDITLFIEKSEEINKGRINIGKGIINVEFYDDKDIQLAITSEAILEEPIQEQIYPEADSELKEKAIGINVDDKTLYDILKEKGEGLMSEDLILAWIDQESSMSQDAELGGCVGLTQASAISFRDVINRNPEKYKKYLSYTDEELTKALKDDTLLNLEVGFDYMRLLDNHYGKVYGFSQGQAQATYGYTGGEVDLLLIAYNAGPTATRNVLKSFGNQGGGNWNDLKEFLKTPEGKKLLGEYPGTNKVKIIINYVENIKKNAGYT